jgi:hypothetical protein
MFVPLTVTVKPVGFMLAELVKVNVSEAAVAGPDVLPAVAAATL